MCKENLKCGYKWLNGGDISPVKVQRKCGRCMRFPGEGSV